MLAARTRPAGPAALCALLLAAFHQAAAEDLPRRLFVGNMVYNMPGVGPHSFIPEAMGGYPEPVPDEVAALGLTTGAPMTNFFAQFGWPFLVLEDGRPVAFTAEPVPTAEATYPEALHLDSLDRRGGPPRPLLPSRGRCGPDPRADLRRNAPGRRTGRGHRR
jgi:hypothetical protein